MKYILNIFAVTLLIFLLGCGNNKDKNQINASGTIESVNVTVSSKAAGQIKRLLVDEGDRVKKGDVLVEIDHDLLDIQIRQAEANVDFANAQLRLLQSGSRQEDIKQTEDLLKQSKINLDQAKTDKDRMESLYSSNSVTKKQLEDAQTKYNLNLSQYNGAKENLQKIKNLARPQEIEQSKANLRKNTAALELLKQNLEDCKVIAPVDGIISKKYVESGEMVNQNSSLLKLSNLETVNLMIYVNEEELGKVKLNQKADISVDTYKDKVYNGKIIFISPEAEFTPKNIQTQDERTKLVFGVKIEIPNPQFELKPGMPADAKIVF
ncbi:MAG: HlyD family secretion protein [Ignavibacteria bacterium]